MSDSEMNGTQPTEPTEDIWFHESTGGERALAIVAGLFGLLVILMAVDMLSGGRVTGFVQDRTGSDQPG